MTFRLLPIVLCLAPLAAASEDSLLKLEEQAFKNAAAKVAPSVVHIQTFGGLDRVGGTLTGVGPTSGVVVSPDGYVMTSAFAFASKPAAAVVRLPDGSQHDAKIVATDYSRMLTLLKTDATGLPVPQSAPAEVAKVGEWTVAVGKAFDPAVPNISPGVLSAKGRVWGKVIQTDAKTSPFNYGGPLLDIRGRVLGVTVPLSMTSDEVMAGADWYDSGIGFAVPFDQVLASFERLKAGNDLHRGTLGVATKEPGKPFAVPIIAKVRDGSPAAEAGLKPGDMIVAIDGRRIIRHADVLSALGPKYAGDRVEITVKRGDEEVSATVTLEKPTKESILPQQKPAEQPGGEKRDEK